MHELELNSAFLGASVHSLECFLLVSPEDLMHYAPKLWRLELPVDPATARIFLESLASILAQIWKKKLTCGWFVQNSCLGEPLVLCALVALASLLGMKMGKSDDSNSLKRNWQRDVEFPESLQFGLADLLLHALDLHWDVQIDVESLPKNHREHGFGHMRFWNGSEGPSWSNREALKLGFRKAGRASAPVPLHLVLGVWPWPNRFWKLHRW